MQSILTHESGIPLRTHLLSWMSRWIERENISLIFSIQNTRSNYSGNYIVKTINKMYALYCFHSQNNTDLSEKMHRRLCHPFIIHDRKSILVFLLVFSTSFTPSLLQDWGLSLFHSHDRLQEVRILGWTTKGVNMAFFFIIFTPSLSSIL